MSTFKRVKVVMLPTNEKANLFTYKNDNTLYNSQTEIENTYKKFKHQHLYILSDEEIKEGDWYYNYDYNRVKECVEIDKEFVKNAIFYEKHSTVFDYSKDCKKIIATTDSSLKIRYEHKIHEYATNPIPSPSKSFIQKYVNEYNKGNIITDILVEYEEYMTDGWIPSYSNPDNHNLENSAEMDIRLKVNSIDNTITIKKVKDSYSRTEVIFLLNGAFGLKTLADLDNWINENL